MQEGDEMDYDLLAKEFMETMHHMRKRKGQKELNDSMQGESFVLFYISHHKDNVTPSDISNAMGITSARIAATLNSLESKGFIERRIDTQDRRRILIDLTKTGKEHVQKHYDMVMTITKNMLKYLGEDDSKEFIRIMKRLADRGGPESFM